MLPDPLEEQFHLPATLVQFGNGERQQLCVVAADLQSRPWKKQNQPVSGNRPGFRSEPRTVVPATVARYANNQSGWYSRRRSRAREFHANGGLRIVAETD